MNKKIEEIKKKNKYRSSFYHKKQEKKKTPHKKASSNRLASFTNKVLMSIVLLFLLLISKDDSHLNFIYNTTFKNMNFMGIQTFVNDKLMGIFPSTDDPNKYVDAIYIDMNNTTPYRDGVIVKTGYSAPVESCVDGIVIHVYKDKDLGKVIVIQDEKGREYSYGYLEDTDVSLYSRVHYGDIIGVGRLTDDMDGEYYLAIKDGDTDLNVINVVNDED